MIKIKIMRLINSFILVILSSILELRSKLLYLYTSISTLSKNIKINTSLKKKFTNVRYVLLFAFIGLFISSCQIYVKKDPVLTKKELRFINPLPNKRVTQIYKPKRNPKHKGIDIAARKGTPIFASEAGIVEYLGSDKKGYGRLIILKHAKGYQTYYSHLHRIKVMPNAKVRKGEVIGTVGKTGRATGYHLHFELRKNKRPINPRSLIKI